MSIHLISKCLPDPGFNKNRAQFSLNINNHKQCFQQLYKSHKYKISNPFKTQIIAYRVKEDNLYRIIVAGLWTYSVNKRIHINNTTFLDWDEVDHNDFILLKEKVRHVEIKKNNIHKY